MLGKGRLISQIDRTPPYVSALHVHVHWRYEESCPDTCVRDVILASDFRHGANTAYVKAKDTFFSHAQWKAAIYYSQSPAFRDTVVRLNYM